MTSIPLKTIIKDFREQLGTREYQTLRQYAERFIAFLKTKVPITQRDRRDNFARVMHWCCNFFHQGFTDTCSEQGVALPPAPLSRDAARLFTTHLRDLKGALQ